MCCSLNRYQRQNTQAANTAAAFVSGAVFGLYPDLTILSHATVSTAKLLWMRFLHGGPLLPRLDDVTLAPMADDRRMLGRMPLSRLLYVFGIGYVFHLRLFYPWICSDLLFKTTFYTSGFM